MPNKYTRDQKYIGYVNYSLIFFKCRCILILYTQPTLVLVGTEDVATPVPKSLQVAEVVPRAWYVQISGGGHGLMYQYPEQFSSIVETFLENTNMP
ncbi:MAG: alpha/beta hydrolase [Candidatus Nitrosocosmicus sp.]|nr:alpha/beta hydrolase [Candidatus Nitrosocosmicus sp.]